MAQSFGLAGYSVCMQCRTCAVVSLVRADTETKANVGAEVFILDSNHLGNLVSREQDNFEGNVANVNLIVNQIKFVYVGGGSLPGGVGRTC